MSVLKLFAFSPAWGLPTSGPFAIKLVAWLNANKIPFELVNENRSGKGPLGKSPWIEIGGKRLGDSDVIIEHLAQRHAIALPGKPATPPAATAYAFKTMFEEHFHQVLEWELFVHPEGLAHIRSVISEAAPGLLVPTITRSMYRHFSRQLHARGIARHTPERIAAIGQADIDALAALLASQPYICGDTPGLADFAVLGQVAPLARWHMQTPVASAVKANRPVMYWCERLIAEYL
ncbi:glutathione S-transferase family protein [Natronohydrobacter thiooxidans]|uniref:glutathione S-transferase family protein n=1 Tax=Natronohydrobacter thiooxidans TaxID=87172 RepID=UPI0008FF317D|nr:glutathione S-transferase family protein [Natronohydrobacter thiooxidans]